MSKNTELIQEIMAEISNKYPDDLDFIFESSPNSLLARIILSNGYSCLVNCVVTKKIYYSITILGHYVPYEASEISTLRFSCEKYGYGFLSDLFEIIYGIEEIAQKDDIEFQYAFSKFEPNIAFSTSVFNYA